MIPSLLEYRFNLINLNPAPPDTPSKSLTINTYYSMEAYGSGLGGTHARLTAQTFRL